MWRVTSGRPRTVRSQNGASPVATQSAYPILDYSKVWSGKPIELISIPNITDEVAYFHIEVAGLQNTEYEINVFQTPLGDPNDLSFPRDSNSNSSLRESEYLRRYYTHTKGRSGAMVTVPANERLNVLLTLRGERTASYGFDVLLSQHLGPDRDSAVTTDNNLDWHFDWLPRPKSGQVALRLQPERVLFRPWNIAPLSRWFFLKWHIGPWYFFNRPRCLLRIENANTLPLSVSPYLVGWQDNFPDIKKRIPMSGVSLNPNEEIEVPCDLELSSKRDIENLVVQAFAQVIIPGGEQPFEVVSPEQITAEWAPYLSRFKDIATLVSTVVLAAVFLVWLFVGIPVPVNPVEIAVPIVLSDKNITEKQLQQSQVTLQPLNESGSPLSGQEIHGYTVIKDRGQMELVFKQAGALLFNRFPFGWTSPHTRHYQISLIPKGDLEKKYHPLDAQPVDVDLSPRNRPLLGPFTAQAKNSVSLLPIYGANLLLTFDLGSAIRATKIDLTFTATNKPPLQRTIVPRTNQLTYPEDISELVGDTETVDIAIDAKTVPDGYIAFSIAHNVTRGMTPTTVSMSGFKKPEIPVTPPVTPPVMNSTSGPPSGGPPSSGNPSGGVSSATPPVTPAKTPPVKSPVKPPVRPASSFNGTHSTPHSVPHPTVPSAIDMPSRLCQLLGVPVRTDNPLGISLQAFLTIPTKPGELAFDLPSRQPCYFQLYSVRGDTSHPLLMYMDDEVSPGPTTRTMDPANGINEMAWTTSDWEIQKPTDDTGPNKEILYILIAVSQDAQLTTQDRKDLIKAINAGISSGTLQPNQWSITSYRWKRKEK